MIVLSDVRPLYTYTFQKNDFLLSLKTFYLKSVNFLFLLSIYVCKLYRINYLEQIYS